MNPEELLSHADFVHSLARSLVADEHRAADVAQDTWLAALEHPPVNRKSIRGWFQRVVRNVTYTMHRGDERRRTREKATTRPKRLPTPEEIVERMEIRRILIDAVLALEEPYRSVVVLRYYEGMKSREIAEQLGIPGATVRTRERRGLEQLRIRLDAKHGGSRNRWLLALAPLAAMKLVSLHKRRTNGDFEVTGLPPGEMKLGISIEGYEQRITNSFVIEEGGTVDLGRIRLKPAGVMDLKVKDPAGRPVMHFEVDWLSPSMEIPDSSFLASGKYRYEKLPIGPVTIRVSAKGYKPKVVLASIEPGKNCEMRVVLERE